MERLSKQAQHMFEFYSNTSVKTPGQRALLLQGLRAFDQAEEAAAIIQREGLAVTSEQSGLTRAHTLLRVQREAAAEMLKVFKLLELERSNYFPRGGFGAVNYPDAV